MTKKNSKIHFTAGLLLLAFAVFALPRQANADDGSGKSVESGSDMPQQGSDVVIRDAAAPAAALTAKKDYLDADYMQKRLKARLVTQDEATNACGMAVTKVALAHPKEAMGNFFCQGTKDLKPFQIPGKADLITVEQGDQRFEYECNYKCYNSQCIWGHTRDDFDPTEGPKTECVFVRHVPEKNKIKSQAEYDAAKNQDIALATKEIRDACARAEPMKVQDVPECRGKTSGAVQSVSRQLQTLPTDLTGDLAGGLLFTCNYDCDCGVRSGKSRVCNMPEHGGASILADPHSWTDDVSARQKGPAK